MQEELLMPTSINRKAKNSLIRCRNIKRDDGLNLIIGWCSSGGENSRKDRDSDLMKHDTHLFIADEVCALNWGT